MRRNGFGQSNEGPLTGKGFGNCSNKSISENSNSFYENRAFRRGFFCRRNDGFGQRRCFSYSDLGEQEAYQARKENLERELSQINDKLKEFQK